MYRATEENLRDQFVDRDVIDLRYLVLTIHRRWKVIATTVLLVATAMFLINWYVVDPEYESSAVIAFRNEDAALDFDFFAFQALASSPKVMGEILRQTNYDFTVNELFPMFGFSFHRDAPVVTVTTRSYDPHVAVGLLEAWISVVRDETQRYVESRLADRKRNVDRAYFTQREKLSEAEEALARFDTEHPLPILMSELERDINELALSEQRLESLKKLTIPASEASANALRNILAQEPTTLGAAGLLMKSTTGGELQIHAANPASLEIRQRLIELESDLAAARESVVHLETSIPELRERVYQKTAELVDAKLQRERLARELVEVRLVFETARVEREAMLARERQLQNLKLVDVVSDPVLPDRPVSDRSTFNLIISVILALIASVLGVLVSEWWRPALNEGRS